MAEILQEIFVNPPIAVARLGGSTTPQNAYRWIASPNPRSSGETNVAPDWSLKVLSDGSVQPVLPTELTFRDGPLIRPVCPFLELWALMGEPNSPRSSWRETPVTPALLTQQGTSLSNLLVRVDAQNRKAARRTRSAEMRFGTFPPVEIRGDNHASVPLLAVSPPGVPASRRLIPAGRNIPLGSFQVLLGTPQPAPGTTPWSQVVDGAPLVNVEVIRFRFTPARGRFYGPPTAAQLHPIGGGSFAPVETPQAFLNPNALWVGINALTATGDIVEPADTYDGSGEAQDRSLGVVDDACDAVIEVILSRPGGSTLTARSNIFVGPPDFAPDRRPFLSLADELNDRAGDNAARTNTMTSDERDAWVQDLFERVYETVSLFNLDHWRALRAVLLTGDRLTTKIPGDNVEPAQRAMGGRDALRNRLFALQAASNVEPLPLTTHARSRHRVLSDLQALRDLVLQSPGRISSLVRRPFELERAETANLSTMRMPPFMRNSNALPLTLASWQYDLLMAWVAATSAAPIPLAVAPEVSPAAAARRAAVLRRVRTGQR
jgi:hypothetical protein